MNFIFFHKTFDVPNSLFQWVDCYKFKHISKIATASLLSQNVTLKIEDVVDHSQNGKIFHVRQTQVQHYITKKWKKKSMIPSGKTTCQPRIDVANSPSFAVGSSNPEYVQFFVTYPRFVSITVCVSQYTTRKILMFEYQSQSIISSHIFPRYNQKSSIYQFIQLVSIKKRETTKSVYRVNPTSTQIIIIQIKSTHDNIGEFTLFSSRNQGEMWVFPSAIP